MGFPVCFVCVSSYDIKVLLYRVTQFEFFFFVLLLKKSSQCLRLAFSKGIANCPTAIVRYDNDIVMQLIIWLMSFPLSTHFSSSIQSVVCWKTVSFLLLCYWMLLLLFQLLRIFIDAILCIYQFSLYICLWFGFFYSLFKLTFVLACLSYPFFCAFVYLLLPCL